MKPLFVAMVLVFAGCGGTGEVGEETAALSIGDTGGIHGAVGLSNAPSPGQFSYLNFTGTSFIGTLQLTASDSMTVQGTLTLNPANHVLMKIVNPGPPPVMPGCGPLSVRLANAATTPVQGWLDAVGGIRVEDLCHTNGSTYSMYPLTDG
jgi:hypothetical protein